LMVEVAGLLQKQSIILRWNGIESNTCRSGSLAWCAIDATNISLALFPTPPILSISWDIPITHFSP
jgi:hypothetical protein